MSTQTEIMSDEFYNKERPLIMDGMLDRTSNIYLDNILGIGFPILDHGFIRVLDYLGDDTSIDSAARISYGDGTKRKTEAAGLINYLMGHDHTSPFEMCEIKLHLKMPIMVMRQWVRQRMASLNEYSARYSKLKDEFYLPELVDIRPQSASNKQGRSEEVIFDKAKDGRDLLMAHSDRSYRLYELLLSEDVDMARELARMALPVNFYTELVWKIDLHNLFKFLRQRTDSHAQMEIRVYANCIEQIVARWVPLAFNAYVNYKRDSISFSAEEVKLIISVLSVKDIPDEAPSWAHKLSSREWKAFTEKISRIRG